MIEVLLHQEGAPTGVPTEVPIVCASVMGFSPLASLLNGDARRKIAPISAWMRNSDDGAYVALIDSPPAPRPIGLIQTNQGVFYRSRHTRSDVIWRDFYYATIYVTLSLIDKRWNTQDVEFAHPTAHGWPNDLVKVLLEVIGHLNAEPKMALRRIHLSCLHDLTRERLDRAAAEIRSESRSRHRPVDVEPVPRSTAGTLHLAGLVLQRVKLASN